MKTNDPKAPGRDIICIGASAGGIEALQQILQELEPNLPVSVFVVLHLPAFQPSHLVDILQRAGPLPVEEAQNGLCFKKGHIYIAPPDHHVLLDADKMVVVKGPKENRFRPAVDPLFRSAAQYHGPRAVGVILSGVLDDGTAGLWALKRAGGLAVMQTDAIFPDMAKSAEQFVKMDHRLKAREIGQVLNQLPRTPVARSRRVPPVTQITSLENEYAKMAIVPRETLAEIGAASSLVCPACNGPLWKVKEGPTRYRCHTGHSFTPAALLVEHRETAERALSVLMTLFDDEVNLLENIVKTTPSKEGRSEREAELKESTRRSRVLRTLLPGKFSVPSKPGKRRA